MIIPNSAGAKTTPSLRKEPAAEPLTFGQDRITNKVLSPMWKLAFQALKSALPQRPRLSPPNPKTKKKTDTPIQGEMNMDQKQILKQMLEFNQTSFNNAFNAMTLLQDQFERVANTVLEQAKLPAEGLKAIENCTETYKSASRTFKQQVDDSYKQVEKAFVS